MAAKYWYKINVNDGANTLGYNGSSPYNEEELVRRIEAGRMIMLDELVHYEQLGEEPVARRLTDGNSNHTGRIYLAAEQIVTLQPLKGNPLENPSVAIPAK